MEAVGVDQLKIIVECAGEVANVVHKVTKGSGIWPIFSLTDDLSSLGVLKADEVLAELKDLSAEERKGLLMNLKSKVALSDAALEAKIEAGVDCLDEVVDFAFKVYGDALQVKEIVEGRIGEGKALFEKIKAVV